MIDFFPIPMMELLFTQRCNMGCTYCFEPNKQNNSMTKEQLLDFVNNLSTINIMMFGGEPLFDMDLFITLYDAIESKQMDEAQKTQLLQSFTVKSPLITNGTLIKDHIDILKKYNIPLQISIDGPKELNDLQRIYKDGRGSFDDVMESINLCIENNISWSTHGAVTATGFQYMPALFTFFWEISKKQCKGDVDQAIGLQANNTFQIIFEDEYSDQDIDNFLKGQGQIFNDILSLPELSREQKIRLLQSWFCRHGSQCLAGSTILAVDLDLNIYACHRPAMHKNKVNNSLGNLKDRSTFKNFKLFNSFLALDFNQQMYSAIKDVNANDPPNPETGFAFQQNWCPSANFETSDTVFYQNAKYNLLIAEYDRFVRELFEYAKVTVKRSM
jgi:sulfatase maturation enzyme AslB (radical SAM superfamily)